MKKVYFLIPKGEIKPSSLFAAVEIFEMANRYFSSIGKKPFWDIHIGGANVNQRLVDLKLYIKTGDLSGMAKPDVIVIPALGYYNDYHHAKNKQLSDWMLRQYQSGCELVSLCTGTFFLASTGLLRDKECATHWAAAESFKVAFPDVKLCTDKIITDSKGIYTAGGAHSSFNLVLYLVEKYNGRNAAIYCSKMLQIDMERNSQSPFMLFTGQKEHGDSDIEKVQLFIEKKVDEKLTVEFLADKFSMSKRTFIRRFKKATGNVPVEYIQKVKMESAKRSLEKNSKNVNEVMYSVGYADLKAFRTIFKKVTGVSPSQYKQKFASAS